MTRVGRRTSGREDVLERLHETYRTQPQIGLVLGAGVTVDSDVPGYLPLALRVYGLAVENGRLRDPRPGVRAYLVDTTPEREPAEAEEIFEHLRGFVGDEELYALVRAALYDGRFPERRYKTVPPSTYRRNPTLDAVISFCAARPGAEHADAEISVRVAANKRVGAILTTNYDNLVEGSFGTKYGRSRVLRPVARHPGPDLPGTIPVYHCHGYISYATPSPEASHLLIAQHDYYAEFYDQLGFGNVVATSFFRRWPSLFIGSSMVDRNIRRVLFQTRRERVGEGLEHFALLKRGGPQDALVDAVLATYGVSVIRIDEHGEIPAILRDLYLAPGIPAEEWEWAVHPVSRTTRDARETRSPEGVSGRAARRPDARPSSRRGSRSGRRCPCAARG